ncbi:unnamed protein product [Protopolystoma xenopodis]|uniref:Secreted protein n=1 Tax=Protopolystoma xenopodis TaxID=117903 RepID=A0A448X143_9PLAT|nr:unnamed protein product [Protopolystoma xenopodis]
MLTLDMVRLVLVLMRRVAGNGWLGDYVAMRVVSGRVGQRQQSCLLGQEWRGGTKSHEGLVDDFAHNPIIRPHAVYIQFHMALPPKRWSHPERNGLQFPPLLNSPHQHPRQEWKPSCAGTACNLDTLIATPHCHECH